MGEVLSQNEIDSLLSSLSQGDIDVEEMKNMSENKRVRSYDFKRPNKFSKGQIQFLHSIYDNFCRALKNDLTAHLHTTITTAVFSIEQISYDEFIRSLPNPTVLGTFALKPLEGTLLLEMDSAMSFAIVDRLLGGIGGDFGQNRDLTDIEKKVLSRRLTQMIDLLRDSWDEVYALEPEFLAIDTNPQFAQVVAPNEIVVLITIEVMIGNTRGMLNLCLPYLVLEPILGKLSTIFLYSTQAKACSPEQTKAIRSKIEGVSVEVVAVLGETEILVRDLLDLAPGDVIPLSQGINSPLPLYVGHTVRFTGMPGLCKERLAVQISEVHTEGRDGIG